MSVSVRIVGKLFIREWPDEEGQITYWCPGCKQAHTITFGGAQSWTWNGDADKPTFSPSVLANGVRGTSSEEWNRRHPRCHSFVRDGMIQYLSDCEHALAGLTVPMEKLPRRWDKFVD